MMRQANHQNHIPLTFIIILLGLGACDDDPEKDVMNTLVDMMLSEGNDAGEVMAGEVMAGEVMAGEVMAGEVMAGANSMDANNEDTTDTSDGCQQNTRSLDPLIILCFITFIFIRRSHSIQRVI